MASNNLKKIGIGDVTIGMFIEDVVDSANRRLIQTKEAIRNENQINRIKKRGIQFVYIDLTKGADTEPIIKKPLSPLEDARQQEAYKREISYFNELEKASDAHIKAIAASRSLINTIKAGHLPETRMVQSAAEEIVASLKRNPEAIISLTQLKGYDEYTFTHSVNVGILIAATAKMMGFSDEEASFAGMGGLLHDIGKMKIPEYIINKPGTLSDSEYEAVKRHTMLGIEMVNSMKAIPDITKKVVLQHHERCDGKGYPFGIRTERIHEIGLVAGAVDVYDALTSDRVYKTAWSPQKALALLFKGIGNDFEGDIVQTFTKQLGIFPVGSFVKLANGILCVVVHVDKESLLTPKVVEVFNKDGERLKEPSVIDLYREQDKENGDQFKITLSLNPATYNIDLNDYLGKKW